MQNAEELTQEQIKEFLQGSRAIEFSCQDRSARYQFVERVLVAQEYAVQAKKQRGTIRAYSSKVSGLSLPQMTRFIRQYSQEGVVKPAAYRRQRFPVIYTSRDIALLAKVDRAHEWLNGPATVRILKREYEQSERVEFVRLAELSVSHLYNLRRSGPGNWRRSGNRRSPAASPSASDGSQIRRGAPVFCGLTRCIKATGRGSKGCITSMPWTR